MEFFEESNLELPTDFVNEYEDMSVGEEVDYDYEELSEFYNSLTMAQKMALMMVQNMAQMEKIGTLIIGCIIFRILTQSCKYLFLWSGLRISICILKKFLKSYLKLMQIAK